MLDLFLGGSAMDPFRWGLESLEKVHQILRQVISTLGHMAKLSGENLQRTSFPILRASDVPWDWYRGWLSSLCSQDPFSILLHSALCSMWTASLNASDCLALVLLVGFIQWEIVAGSWGQGECEVVGFIFPARSTWLAKQLPQDGWAHYCPLGTTLFFALPTLGGVVPAPCSYLFQGTALSFEISLNPDHTSANCLSINLS